MRIICLVDKQVVVVQGRDKWIGVTEVTKVTEVIGATVMEVTEVMATEVIGATATGVTEAIESTIYLVTD